MSNVQKDKHPALRPHYEKCVFIGYPDGYKGWKFYNPTTKHTVISERADFDERPSVAAITPNAVPALHQICLVMMMKMVRLLLQRCCLLRRN